MEQMPHGGKPAQGDLLGAFRWMAITLVLGRVFRMVPDGVATSKRYCQSSFVRRIPDHVVKVRPFKAQESATGVDGVDGVPTPQEVAAHRVQGPPWGWAAALPPSPPGAGSQIRLTQDSTTDNASAFAVVARFAAASPARIREV